MEPGKYYHLYTHANGSENLFRADENFQYFLRRYQAFIPPVADTLAWCLMPNHLHLLVRIKREEAITSTFGKFQTFQKLEYRISKQFANLFSSYTQAYNKMYARRGSLFIPNFKRKEITSDNHLTTLIRYIHTNPIRHGFTQLPEQWPWSSYTAILTGNTDPLITNDSIKWFGNKEEFIRLHHPSGKVNPEER
jgi:REP element-mobilizing transposase RayT